MTVAYSPMELKQHPFSTIRIYKKREQKKRERKKRGKWNGGDSSGCSHALGYKHLTSWINAGWPHGKRTLHLILLIHNYITLVL